MTADKTFLRLQSFPAMHFSPNTISLSTFCI